MTNAEKYLKENVDVNEFVSNFLHECNCPEVDLMMFLKGKAKPILSEDEKVILRNIDKGNYDRIGVLDDCLYIKGDFDCDKDIFHYMYHGLFKFIGERRRI